MRSLPIMLIAAALAAALLGAPRPAQAQTSTSGAVRGTILDQASDQPVAGATVVISGPALQGVETEISDESGEYHISNLPPGVYLLTVYYGEARFQRRDVLVQLGKQARVNIRIDVAAGLAAGGEVIVIEGPPPLIDQASTKTGVTITSDYTHNIPAGRTFGDVLGAAAGSQEDLFGVSYGGSTSVENVYIIDGFNTTDPAFGLLTSNLPNEFIQETEVITGGYNAEYGRSTGGVINVITRTGGNEFHGSVFGYWRPGALEAARVATPTEGSAIDAERGLQNAFDLGAELGGPIVKDRLWFHVGFNPSFHVSNVDRIINRYVDADQDGVADDDANGHPVLEEVSRRAMPDDVTRRYYFSTKLTGAVAPEHRGQLSLTGSPHGRDSDKENLRLTGADPALLRTEDRQLYDLAFKWTSELFGNKTKIDALIGYHHDAISHLPGHDDGGGVQATYEAMVPLAEFSAHEPGGVPEACIDGTADDPYPDIANCPVRLYSTGGLGYLTDTTASRLAGVLSITQRIRAAGHHIVKAGIDLEQQKLHDESRFTGGVYYVFRPSGLWDLVRFYSVDDDGDKPCGNDLDFDGVPDATCSQRDLLIRDTHTQNRSAYVQDSWSVLPNLTINLGLRWEQQTLFNADQLRGQVSGLTGEVVGDEAFELGDMLAPRLGVIYDVTEEGRSRLYGHWGRFYESIPMLINGVVGGGGVASIQRFAPGACDFYEPVGSCDPDAPNIEVILDNGQQLVAPGLRAQYLDEWLVGAEVELMANLKVGVSYSHRQLGRVIEDVITSTGTSLIANPSEADAGAIQSLREDAAAMADSDPLGAALKRFEANIYEEALRFDAPDRRHDAVQLSLDKRFSAGLYVHASYTYSRLRGNFPGLFAPEIGLLAPNLTSAYDAAELMTNRVGPLALNRTHNLQMDGYYTLDMKNIGMFVFGSRVRAQSGRPQNVLGAHWRFGNAESYLLPRGAAGDLPMTTNFDIKAAYGRPLSAGRRLDVFVDIFNVFNQQPPVATDDEYTWDVASAVSGGDADDLRHIKAQDGPATTASGAPISSGQVVEQNPNYGNATARQYPLTVRLGARLTF